MQKFIFSLCAFIIASIMTVPPGLAQEAKPSQEISGIVKDSTGAVVPEAQIGIQGSDVTALSDAEGKFVLKNIRVGKMAITVTHSGFAAREIPIEVRAGQDLALEIGLELEPQEYSVTVDENIPKLMSASESIGVVSILPNQVATLPSLGEKDVFRSIQLMPGVSGSMESSSGLYIRGGTPDQNLILFDGFTVYKVDHFFGIFSAFNANAIDSTTIFKGGFDSKFGGRLSSVVDLTGRTGNRDEVHVGGGISLLSYNAYVDGPLGKKGTFMLAGRRSFQTPISNKIRENYTSAGAGPGGGNPFGQFTFQPNTSFYDLNGRATYDLSSKDFLIFSSYYGRDNFDNSRTMNLPPRADDTSDQAYTGTINDLSHWTNIGASLNWRRLWSPTFTSNFTLAFSRYLKNADRSADFQPSDDSTTTTTDESKVTTNGSSEGNRLNDVTFRWANNLILGHRHFLEFGAEATRNQVNYYFNFNADAAQFTQSQSGLQQAFYVQDQYRPIERLEITPGVRATYYNLTKQFYADPRLSLIVHASSRLRFKAATGVYHQFTSDLTREDPMQGDQDFWLLAGQGQAPVSRAEHYIGGVSYETPGLLFDIEAYRKNLRGMTEFGSYRPGIPRERGEGDATLLDFSNSFFTGSGKAEGVEFLAQKKFGSNTGWITYTLGRVMYDFPSLSSGLFPASQDSTHEVKIVDSHRWKSWTFSGNWIYATGKPFTEPTGSDEITLDNGRTIYIPIFGTKNGIRLPNYHRLDLSATWDFYRGESRRVRIGVSAFNVYKHSNIWRRQYNIFDGELYQTDVKYLGLTLSTFVNVDLDVPSEARRAGPAFSKSDPNKKDSVKRPDPQTKVYEFYGEVVSTDLKRFTIKTRMGIQEFQAMESTVLGEPAYEVGAYVHVYYRKENTANIITMMFRKVNKRFELQQGT